VYILSSSCLYISTLIQLKNRLGMLRDYKFLVQPNKFGGKQKMKTKTIFGLFALLFVGMVLSTSLVSAYRGDYSVKGLDYNADRHEEMQQAFETLDYDAWYALMTENERHGRVVDVVTESNFVKFAEAHQAAENGDFETAAQLRAELGLNNGHGPKDGTGFGKGMGQGKGESKGQGKGYGRR
jgi:hypothetical protein